ncbi:MAG: dicarboxylate/amino acid:cation symporter [Elusimicrobiota bacterium]
MKKHIACVLAVFLAALPLREAAAQAVQSLVPAQTAGRVVPVVLSAAALPTNILPRSSVSLPSDAGRIKTESLALHSLLLPRVHTLEVAPTEALNAVQPSSEHSFVLPFARTAVSAAVSKELGKAGTSSKDCAPASKESPFAGLLRFKDKILGHGRQSRGAGNVLLRMFWDGQAVRAVAEQDAVPASDAGRIGRADEKSFLLDSGEARKEGGLSSEIPSPAAEPGDMDDAPAPGGVFHQLWFWIIISLTAAVASGLLLAPGVAILPAQWVPALSFAVDASARWGGLFLTILKRLAGPLIFSSVVSSLSRNENAKELRSVGWRAMIYFLFTSFTAGLIGMGMAALIRPGAYFMKAAAALAPAGVAGTTAALSMPSFGGFLRRLIPSDPLTPFLTCDMLQIVIMAALAGTALLLLNTRSKGSVKKAAEALTLAVDWIRTLAMRLIRVLMLTAPIAVFGMIARLFATAGTQSLLGMSIYVGTVVLALAALVGFYCVMIALFAKRSPRWFLSAAREAVITGFSTASSTATLPVSMRIAREKLGVEPHRGDFLLTLCAAGNMEGTLLYQIIATMFLAQAFGIALSFGSLLAICGMLFVASFGTPGAPGAGMAVLSSVLSSFGIPLQGIALILGVDRILDMARTGINVMGDLTGVVVLDAFLNRKAKKSAQ